MADAHMQFFVQTFSFTAPIHLYSAEPVESLSDKAVKEWGYDGFEGGAPTQPQWWKWVLP